MWWSIDVENSLLEKFFFHHRCFRIHSLLLFEANDNLLVIWFTQDKCVFILLSLFPREPENCKNIAGQIKLCNICKYLHKICIPKGKFRYSFPSSPFATFSSMLHGQFKWIQWEYLTFFLSFRNPCEFEGKFSFSPSFFACVSGVFIVCEFPLTMIFRGISSADFFHHSFMRRLLSRQQCHASIFITNSKHFNS